MKQTQLSAALSPGLEESAGPKMLSRSAMEGLCVSAEVSSAFTSEESGLVVLLGGGEVGTFLGGRGGSASVLCSSNAVSSGGPNKAIASSGTGDLLLLGGSGTGTGTGAGAGVGLGEGTETGATVGTERLGRAISISSLGTSLFARAGLRLCDQQKGRENRHQRRRR